MREATLVFDGNCGFCTRCARLLARLDRDRRVTLRPSQAPGVEAEYRLTRAQLDESVWLVAGDRLERGPWAIAGALDAALGVQAAGRLVRVAPIGWFADVVYRWVADHRRLLPGATPWCESHPGQCSDGERQVSR